MTVKRGVRQPGCTFKILSRIIPLPVYSHPMAPIIAGIQTPFPGLENLWIWPLLSFQLHFTSLSLSLSTVQADLLSASHSCLWIFDLIPLTALKSFSWLLLGFFRFWLKCHILKGSSWTTNPGKLLGYCLPYCVCTESLSCVWLWNPLDCSLPVSSAHGMEFSR